MSSDLWRFAESFYQRPEVEQACLTLQGLGSDVCLLLCAAWLGKRGVSYNPEHAEKMRLLARPWQHGVVTALRQLRQDWRTAANHDSELALLREQVKRLEIEAERIQLQRLAALTVGWQDGPEETLMAWLQGLAPVLNETGRDALEQLHIAAQYR